VCRKVWGDAKLRPQLMRMGAAAAQENFDDSSLNPNKTPLVKREADCFGA